MNESRKLTPKAWLTGNVGLARAHANGLDLRMGGAQLAEGPFDVAADANEVERVARRHVVHKRVRFRERVVVLDIERLQLRRCSLALFSVEPFPELQSVYNCFRKEYLKA